jgi:hypothetical protein
MNSSRWPAKRRRTAAQSGAAAPRLALLPELLRTASTHPEERIQHLALAFPTLRRAGGVQPWQPHALDAWACGPLPGEDALHAARFVLALWDNAEIWSCGRFDAIEALAVWDGPHRGAFLTWVAPLFLRLIHHRTERLGRG